MSFLVLAVMIISTKITQSALSWDVPQSPVFSSGRFGMCVGYLNETIFIIGGTPIHWDVVEYDTIHNQYTEHHSVLWGTGPRSSDGKHYTQIDHMIYIYHYFGPSTYKEYLGSYNMQTKTYNPAFAQKKDADVRWTCLTHISADYLVVVGGHLGNVPLTDTVILNISQNVWVNGPSMMTPRVYLTCNVHSNTLWAIGGYNSYNGIWWDSVETLYVSDINTIHNNAWNMTPDTLSMARGHLRSVVHHDLIYVIGGMRYDADPWEMHYVDVIDTSARTITQETNLSISAWDSAAIVAPNINTLFVFGGGRTPAGGNNLDTMQTALLPTYSPTLVPSKSPTNPTAYPTTHSPTSYPTNIPSNHPTLAPSSPPTLAPSFAPSMAPSSPPTSVPSLGPSLTPSLPPTSAPSLKPSVAPTLAPSSGPTLTPSFAPSVPPSSSPTLTPSSPPTSAPSLAPSSTPTLAPSSPPTIAPSSSPTLAPSVPPTLAPSLAPSFAPSLPPTLAPSSPPTLAPSTTPTLAPSLFPTSMPSFAPSFAPSIPPTLTPSGSPTSAPSLAPTTSPTSCVDLDGTYNTNDGLNDLNLNEIAKTVDFAANTSSFMIIDATAVAAFATRTIYLNQTRPQLVCTGIVACFQSNIFCSLDQAHCNILCDGYLSCSEATIHANDIQNVHVICSGELSCSELTLSVQNITLATTIDCVKSSSCDSLAVSFIDNGQSQITCYLSNACNGLHIYTTDHFHTRLVLYSYSQDIIFDNGYGLDMPRNNIDCKLNHRFIRYDSTLIGHTDVIHSLILSEYTSDLFPCYNNVNFLCDNNATQIIESCILSYSVHSISTPISYPQCYWVSISEFISLNCPGNCATSPTFSPSSAPTHAPTHTTISPTAAPSYSPTLFPSSFPTRSPSHAPTYSPSHSPSNVPTRSPSDAPTYSPSHAPSNVPTRSPSPTLFPSSFPTRSPSHAPTYSPSHSPSNVPTRSPSDAPTYSPSHAPSNVPTRSPSRTPTYPPSHAPSNTPSHAPTDSPSYAPSSAPTQTPTNAPSFSPSNAPTTQPSKSPTDSPTHSPSIHPTISPTSAPILAPTAAPTFAPSEVPSVSPSLAPSFSPSSTPTQPPSRHPTSTPSLAPTLAPSLTPTFAPSLVPSIAPSLAPSITPSRSPSFSPSQFPTLTPSLSPTFAPSLTPSIAPTLSPSVVPSLAPSVTPTLTPSFAPTLSPSHAPSLSPSKNPTKAPSATPTSSPTASPTRAPTKETDFPWWIDIVYGIQRYTEDDLHLLLNDSAHFVESVQGILELHYFSAVSSYELYMVQINQINDVLVQRNVEDETEREDNSFVMDLEIDLEMDDLHSYRLQKPIILTSQIWTQEWNIGGSIITRSTDDIRFLEPVQTDIRNYFSNNEILFTMQFIANKPLNAIPEPPKSTDWSVVIVSSVVVTIASIVSLGAFIVNKKKDSNVDNASFLAPMFVGLQIYDLISDVNLAIEILMSHTLSLDNTLTWCGISALFFTIAPFISNVFYAVTIHSQKVIKNNTAASAYFKNHLTEFILIVVFTGGCFPSLSLVASRCFALDIFNCGLTVFELNQLSKIKIRSTITLENGPQLIIQVIYSVLIRNLSTSIVLAFNASLLSIIATVAVYYAQTKAQNSD
eukprot:44691_1